MAPEPTCPYCESPDIEPCSSLVLHKCHECGAYFDEEEVMEFFHPSSRSKTRLERDDDE